MRELEAKLTLNKELINAPNLCDRFTNEDLTAIGGTVHQGWMRDKQSRAKWEERNGAAMDLAMQIQEPKNFPWAGASNVVFPLVTIASLQFSARSYSNLIQGTRVVRYRVIGKADEQAHQRALRIGKHMSWQMLEEDESWEEQHDRLLINLAVVGCNFVKTWFDPSKGYPVGELVMAKDFVLDYYAKSVENCMRKTHRIPLYRNEVWERAKSGRFADLTKEQWFDSPPALKSDQARSDKRAGMNPPQPDEYTPFTFQEQHTWFDFDKDGYAEPYIVTIEETSRKIARIVSRIPDMDCITFKNDEVIHIKAEEYFTKYSFIPSPDGGIYDMGFGVFLGPINEAVNSGINQLIDSGTMQNSLGGFLGRGAKIRGGSYVMAPWEWKRVDSTGDDLKKSIVPFPDRAPNDVMFKLLGLMIEYANRIAGTTDPTVGENPGQNTPASTFQGMTEQGLQVYSMIFKRVWRSVKEESKRRYEINSHYLDDAMDFGAGNDFIRKEDYTGNPDQIVPVANPRITSTVMKIEQAALVKQSAMGTPGYDVTEAEKSWLEALEVEEIDRLFPGPGKVPPGHEAMNPKVMVEQLKAQVKQMQIKADMQMFANQLLEEQRVNNAKIMLLQAQAAKAATEAKGAEGAQRLEDIKQLIELHQQYGDMMNKRIQALLGGGGGQEADGEGVSGMAKQPEHGGGNGVSVNVPGGSAVTVGEQGVH